MKKIFTLIIVSFVLIFQKSVAQCFSTTNIGYELNPVAPGQVALLPSYPSTANQGTVQSGNNFNANLKAGYNYTFNGITQGYVTLFNANSGDVYYNGFPSSVTGFTISPTVDMVVKFSYTSDGPIGSCTGSVMKISPNLTSACNSTVTSTITSVAVIIQNVPALCTSTTSIVVRPSLTPGGSLSYTYLWDNGETSSAPASLGLGIHAYTITGGCSGIYIGAATITGLQANLTATGGVFLCSGNVKNIGARWSSSSYKTEKYLWNDGIITYGPRSTSIPGTYFATITNTQTGCVFAAQPFNLIEDKAKPTIVVTSGEPEICNSNTVSIASTGWLKNNPTNFSYLWSNGSAATSISTSSPGTFTLTMTDLQDGCTATSLPIQVTTGNDRIIKATTNSFCPGSGNYPILTAYSNSLRAVSAVLGTFSGSNSTNIIGNADGNTYDANNNTESTLPEIVNLSFTGSGSIGYVTLVVTKSEGTIVSPPLSDIVFKARNPGSGLFETIAGINNGLPIPTTGNYQRTFEFVQTSFSVTEMQIVFLRQSLAKIILDAVYIGKTPIWSTSQYGSSIVVTSPGVYSVTSVNTCDVENAYQPITITTVSSTVIVTPPISQTACGGNFATFTMSASGDNLAYAWSNGVQTPFTTVANAGTYVLSVTGTCGTAVSSPVTLTKYVNTSIVTQPISKNICAGDVTQLNISAVGQNLTYLWSNSNTNVTINTSVAGVYKVTVTGYCGTQVSNSANVIMKDPKAFQCSGLTQPQIVDFKLPNKYRAADDSSRFGIVGINLPPFSVLNLVSGNSGNIVALHSSNTAVAIITSDNKIQAVGAGTTSITGIQSSNEDYDQGSHTELLIVDPLLPRPNIAISNVLRIGYPIVTWDTIVNARSYCIKVFDNPSLSHVVGSACNLTVTTFTLPITPDLNTEYYVQIAGENASGVSPYSLVVKNIVTEILPDHILSSLSLYPNPTSGAFFIKGLDPGFNILVYNVIGQLIYSGPYTLKGISTDQYKDGIYFVKIGSRTLKLIVKS